MWDELTKQAYEDGKLDRSLTVKKIMDKWTLQKGYPVVDVKYNSALNHLQVKQNWFLLNPLNKVDPSEYNSYKWYVPFTYTTSSDPNFNLESDVSWLKPEDSQCK